MITAILYFIIGYSIGFVIVVLFMEIKKYLRRRRCIACGQGLKASKSMDVYCSPECPGLWR